MKPWLANLAAIGAALLAIVVISAVWIVFLRNGPKLDAWVAGPMIVAVPLALLVLTAMWLLARVALARWVEWNSVRVLAGSLMLAYLVTAITCGPIACFQALPSFWVGWFLVLGAAIAACVHHATFTQLLGRLRVPKA
jgi:hypothetical protein